MTVRRFDSGELRTPRKLSNGMLKADAFITRAGVFPYRTPDGKTRLEWRPPDEVFHADSIESFELCPVTLGHPGVPVTAENAKQYSVGNLGDLITRAGEKVRGALLVSTPEGIRALHEKRSHTEVSCGYTCDLDETPGTTPDGQRYDAVQRNIRGNHVALVPRGRAGPEVRVRLDAADAEMITDEADGAPQPRKQEKRMTVKTRIDGVEFDSNEQLNQAVAREFAKRDAEVAAMKAEIETLKKERETIQAKADQLDTDLKKAKADAAEATDPAKMQARVDARAQLLGSARKVLGKAVKLDAMPDLEVQKAVLGKLLPKAAAAQLKDKSEDYITARFEAAIESWKADSEDDEVPANARTRALAERGDEDEDDDQGDEREDEDEGGDEDEEPTASRNDSRDRQPATREDARAAMIKDSVNAWRTPEPKRARR